MDNKILDNIEDELKNGSFDKAENKENIIRHIEQLKKQKLNVMFAGATGVGKSSTINAIFNMEIAKVGYNVDPETATIQKYEIDNMVLWDTPGLGDNPEKDKKYAIENITSPAPSVFCSARGLFVHTRKIYEHIRSVNGSILKAKCITYDNNLPNTLLSASAQYSPVSA